ncbi:uncharacterized protein LOC122635240 isoform X2 [Vespula pensylvanica]|uniref:uncharacterized protein LOC122635240 isoform X2 n=1 Tax=Vespula pensylvanica TaxID=30213 RepID=UPI001CB9E811|nr:uncharacterized protein LOC122635240 isoform X2 [Vespula pensylvanica]
MILLTKPELIYLDKTKLHISRRPRFLTWLIFGYLGKECFKRLPKKYKSTSISKEMLYSTNEMNDFKHSLQQHLSSPLLGSEKIVKICQEKHLRKGPYTANTASFTYSKYMKPTSVRSYEHDTNLKIC